MSTMGQNLTNEVTSEVKTRSGWGIFLGVLTVIIGILMIAYPLATAAVTTVFIGSMLIVVGVIELFQAFRAHRGGSFFLRLLLGIVFCIGGIYLLAFPLQGVAVLTSVLGFMLLFEAAFILALAFQIKGYKGWGWLLFDSAITALLGFLILAHWPSSAFWAIGTLVGVAVMIHGFSRIFLSAGMRKTVKRVEQFPTQRAA